MNALLANTTIEERVYIRDAIHRQYLSGEEEKAELEAFDEWADPEDAERFIRDFVLGDLKPSANQVEERKVNIKDMHNKNYRFHFVAEASRNYRIRVERDSLLGFANGIRAVVTSFDQLNIQNQAPQQMIQPARQQQTSAL